MDKALLFYHMAKKGYKVKEMAQEMCISRSAFYRKCNGNSEFTLKEIQQIMDLLQLDTPMGVFFSGNPYIS